jgi:purine-cytosine permease-like protein
MAITLKQRAYAGLWFTAAGVAPWMYRLRDFLPPVPESDFLEFVIWFILVPALIAGLLGALLGAAILDPHKVKSIWNAAFRGFIIAVLSFLLSAVLISAQEAYTHEYESFVGILFMMLLVGGMVIGWMAVIVGTFAGLMLHQLRTSRPFKTNLP